MECPKWGYSSKIWSMQDTYIKWKVCNRMIICLRSRSGSRHRVFLPWSSSLVSLCDIWHTNAQRPQDWDGSHLAGVCIKREKHQPKLRNILCTLQQWKKLVRLDSSPPSLCQTTHTHRLSLTGARPTPSIWLYIRCKHTQTHSTPRAPVGAKNCPTL